MAFSIWSRFLIRFLHLMAFSVIVGNVIFDYIFLPRTIRKVDKTLHVYVYILAWVTLLVTGIISIIMLVIDNKYLYDNAFSNWIKILLWKTLLSFIMGIFLEFLMHFVIKDDAFRKDVVLHCRLFLGILITIISVYSRLYREAYLTSAKKVSPAGGEREKMK